MHNFRGPRVLGYRKGRCTWFKYSCFVPSNCLDGRSELCNMVHSKRHDSSYNRISYYVCCIILSAIVDLEYCRIDLFFDEGVESQ